MLATTCLGSGSVEKSLGPWRTVSCTGATLEMAAFGTVAAGTAETGICSLISSRLFTLEKTTLTQLYLLNLYLSYL